MLVALRGAIQDIDKWRARRLVMLKLDNSMCMRNDIAKLIFRKAWPFPIKRSWNAA